MVATSRGSVDRGCRGSTGPGGGTLPWVGRCRGSRIHPGGGPSLPWVGCRRGGTGVLVVVLVVAWMVVLAQGNLPEHIDKRFEPRTGDQCFGQTIPIQCETGQMVQVTKVFYRQSQQCRGSFHSNFCTHKRFEPRTVDQCFGQTIPIQCEMGQMVQVTKVFYRQSQQCRGSFHSNFCTREEASNPACVGNDTCQFTTPYIYLSPECGYSNNFLVTYKCIPAHLPRDVCLEGTITANSGYVVSPSYPAKYPAGKNCKVTITTPPGTLIQVYLIDLYLAYYNYDVTKQCVDTLWIVGQGEKDRTGYLCSGKQRGLIFTSQTNKITIYFTSKGHQFLNAKGFWLFFQAVTKVATTPPSTVLPSVERPVTEQPEPSILNTDVVHSLQPTEPQPTRTSTKPVTRSHKPPKETRPKQHKAETKTVQKDYIRPVTKAVLKDAAAKIATRHKAFVEVTTAATTHTAQTPLQLTTYRPVTFPIEVDYTEVHHGGADEPMQVTQAAKTVSTEATPFPSSSLIQNTVPETTHLLDGMETQLEQVRSTSYPTKPTFMTTTTTTVEHTEPTQTSSKSTMVAGNINAQAVTPSAKTTDVTPKVQEVSVSRTTKPVKIGNEKVLSINATAEKANPGTSDSENKLKIETVPETKTENKTNKINATIVEKPTILGVMPTTTGRLKVPLWAKEPPSQSAVFFRKISDTTRKGIVGGAGGFLVLMLVVTVLVILFKRRQSNGNKCTASPMMPPRIKPENYDDIILAYGSNDSTKGFINVGFENESLQDFPLDNTSNSGSVSAWGGTLGSNRCLNPIDEGPEIVYMDAKTAMNNNPGTVDGKKAKRGNKVRWVKSKSLDDIRHTIRYTQRQMTRASLRPAIRQEEQTNDKEPFTVSLGWLDEEAEGSSGDIGGSSRSFVGEPGSRLQAHLAAGKQYQTMANLNLSSVSETTLYSNPSTTDTSSFSFTDMDKADASPYETVHFQHQDEVAL